MKTADPIYQGHWRSFWRYVALLALLGSGAVTLVILLTLAWFVTRDASAHKQLLEEVQKLDAAGLPYDDPSLAEYYARASDEGNVDQWMRVLAAVDSEFLKAAQSFEPWSETEERVPFAGEAWLAEAQTLQFLETWADLRRDAEQVALQDRRVRFPIEFDSVNTDLSALQQVRELSRLLSLHAQVMIRNRDSASTRDAILSILGCARATEAQPFWVGQVVRSALENIAIEELRYAVQADVLHTGDLKLILARIHQRPSLKDSWQRTLHGERACGLPLFTVPEKYAEYVDDEELVRLPWRSRDALAFLESIDQALAVPTHNLHDFYVGTQEFEERLTQELRAAGPLEMFDEMICRFARLPVGALGKALAENELFVQRAMLGVSIRLYEDQHGSLPDSLNQLSEVGLDSSKFRQANGKAFQYRRTDGQAVLWSGTVVNQASVPGQSPDAPDEPADYPSTDPSDFWSRTSVWHFPRAADALQPLEEASAK